MLPESSLESLYKLLEVCKANGAKVIFDNNYRPKLWSTRDLALMAYAKVLSYNHTALLTSDDEEALHGDTAIEQCIKHTKGAGVQEILIFCRDTRYRNG